MTKYGWTGTAVLGFIAAISTFVPATASAFCGFYVAGKDGPLYNNATQVVLMRSGKTTVLSMQNSYKGPPQNFAMVVPVPEVLSKDNVKILPAGLFKHVNALAAPRLVEYWEQDPCAPPQIESLKTRSTGGGGSHVVMQVNKRELGVTVEAQFSVGEYEVVVLSAKYSTGLNEWLHREKYKIPAGAEKYLRPYVASGSKFFVAKVDASKVKFIDGVAQLSPLRFHYQSDSFSLPIRLGLMNSDGKQDLIIHIVAQGKRYQLANYPNVTIPTNLDVSEEVGARFAEFYAALFDSTIEKNPKAVVTEYAWTTSSCDPCPMPPLGPGELATLGYDVIGRARQGLPRRGGFGPGNGFVLTRLHARYGKDDIGEDLVFEVAPPIVGGREIIKYGPSGAEGLEHGSLKSSFNNFQARYAMRHKWKGAIDCAAPVRGKWGGPPGRRHSSKPIAATNLAFAARGGMSLAAMVPAGIPELGIRGLPGSAYRNGNTLPTVVPGDPVVPKYAGKTELPSGLSGENRFTDTGPSHINSKRGSNGCSLGGVSRGRGRFWMSLGVLALLWRRRRCLLDV